MSIDLDLHEPATSPIPTAGTPTECPRCGAPAISTRGVAAHTKWHADEDRRISRLTKLMTALEAMLATFAEEDEDGETTTFRDWVTAVDENLRDHAEGLGKLAELLAARPAATAVPWLADVGEPVEIPPMPETGDPVDGEPDEDGASLPDDVIDVSGLIVDEDLPYDPADFPRQPTAAEEAEDDEDPDAVDHPAARRF